MKILLPPVGCPQGCYVSGLVLGLLAAGYGHPAAAQGPAASLPIAAELPASQAALDTIRGLGAYRFGMVINNLPGPLTEISAAKKGRLTCRAPLAILTVAGRRLANPRLVFYNGRLASLYFSPATTASADQLLQSLRARYGQGQKIGSQNFVWLGREVSVLYEVLATPRLGRRGRLSSQRQVVVGLVSNALAKQEAAEQAQP